MKINITHIILFIVPIVIILGWLLWRFRQKITKLKDLAYTDDLGILNQRELKHYLKNLIKNSSYKPFAFMLIDIDRFKNFNDLYGYDKADLILQEFVNITKSFIRKTDRFFRYKSGDEFVLIFSNTDIEAAKEIGNRLRRVVAYHPFMIDDLQLNITISMGITCSFNSDTADEIRHRAELALHEAKHTKNTVVLLEDHRVLTA